MQQSKAIETPPTESEQLYATYASHQASLQRQAQVQRQPQQPQQQRGQVIIQQQQPQQKPTIVQAQPQIIQQAPQGIKSKLLRICNGTDVKKDVELSKFL